MIFHPCKKKKITQHGSMFISRVIYMHFACCSLNPTINCKQEWNKEDFSFQSNFQSL